MTHEEMLESLKQDQKEDFDLHKKYFDRALYVQDRINKRTEIINKFENFIKDTRAL